MSLLPSWVLLRFCLLFKATQGAHISTEAQLSSDLCQCKLHFYYHYIETRCILNVYQQRQLLLDLRFNCSNEMCHKICPHCGLLAALCCPV